MKRHTATLSIILLGSLLGISVWRGWLGFTSHNATDATGIRVDLVVDDEKFQQDLRTAEKTVAELSPSWWK